MELKLKRIARKTTYTIGRLYVNGAYFCDTLEDTDRDINRNGRFDNGEKKVYAQTAIPNGEYQVVMNIKSPRFSQKSAYAWCGGYLPRLVNVPNFEGVLIHAGNSAVDSAGCILVGKNTIVGKLTDSMATLKKLYPILKTASDSGENIWLIVE